VRTTSVPFAESTATSLPRHRPHPIRKFGDGSLPVSAPTTPTNGPATSRSKSSPALRSPSGVLATAIRITPNKYPYSISTEWDAPWRTERIYRVLESGRKFSVADMLSLQTDVYSAFDRFCAERLVYALDHCKNPSRRAQQARELMRDWDGRQTIDSAPPPSRTARCTNSADCCWNQSSVRRPPRGVSQKHTQNQDR